MFCAWSLAGAPWRIGDVTFPKGKDPDGSEDLLAILDGECETYAKFAKAYVGRAISLAAVKKVHAHAPLTLAPSHVPLIRRPSSPT